MGAAAKAAQMRRRFQFLELDSSVPQAELVVSAASPSPATPSSVLAKAAAAKRNYQNNKMKTQKQEASQKRESRRKKMKMKRKDSISVLLIVWSFVSFPRNFTAGCGKRSESRQCALAGNQPRAIAEEDSSRDHAEHLC